MTALFPNASKIIRVRGWGLIYGSYKPPSMELRGIVSRGNAVGRGNARMEGVMII